MSTTNDNSTTQTDSDAAFIASMHALPTELFDQIKDLVFTPSDFVCPIEKESFRLPAQLQVDHATRESFAAKWYGHKTFIVDSEIHGDTTCRQWLESLTPQHQAQINTIWLDGRMLRDGIAQGTLLSIPDDALVSVAVTDEHRARADAMIDMRAGLRGVGNGQAQLLVRPDAFRMWVCRSLAEGRQGIMMWAGSWMQALYALMS